MSASRIGKPSRATLLLPRRIQPTNGTAAAPGNDRRWFPKVSHAGVLSRCEPGSHARRRSSGLCLGGRPTAPRTSVVARAVNGGRRDDDAVSSPSTSQLSDAIIVGHLQTPLEGATVLSPEAPVRSALRELTKDNYDQAPVVDDHGVPIGFALTRDLAKGRGRVANHVRPVLPNALASDMSPLQNALPWLQLTGFLFLLTGQRISGFVVPSDLNKQAGRTYLYLGLAALELALADEVRRLGRSQELLAFLPPPAAKGIKNRLRRNVALNVEADIVAEMNLSHLFHIVGSDSDLLARLGVSAEAWATFWKPINDLRGRVAHSTRPVLETTAEFSHVVEVDHTVHSLVARLQPDGQGSA